MSSTVVSSFSCVDSDASDRVLYFFKRHISLVKNSFRTLYSCTITRFTFDCVWLCLEWCRELVVVRLFHWDLITNAYICLCCSPPVIRIVLPFKLLQPVLVSNAFIILHRRSQFLHFCPQLPLIQCFSWRYSQCRMGSSSICKQVR